MHNDLGTLLFAINNTLSVICRYPDRRRIIFVIFFVGEQLQLKGVPLHR